MDAAQAGRRGVQGIPQGVKKHFARISAGRLTKSAFYAWSEEARRKKEDCDSGVITAEEFSRWLKES